MYVGRSMSALANAPNYPKSRGDYKVAIICALPEEKDAVDEILENRVPRSQTLGGVGADDNGYTFGMISGYHVVVALLPGIGSVNATPAAIHLLHSFREVQLCLIVGICAVVPVTLNNDGEVVVERVLGDVVISTDIRDYDFGRQNEGEFIAKYNKGDQPGKPITKLRNFYADLKTKFTKQELSTGLQQNLQELLSKDNMADCQYPGKEYDQAYKSGYIHRHQPGECPACDNKPPCQRATKLSCKSLECSPDQLITRKRQSTIPEIHLGTVGVADLTMKSSQSRDSLAAEEGIIAFEMESVGPWDLFPTVVIKGGCDYGDSHKNKKFQPYAAVTAAACAKAFLSMYKIEVQSAGTPQTIPETNPQANSAAPSEGTTSRSQGSTGNNSGAFSGSNYNADSIYNTAGNATFDQRHQKRGGTRNTTVIGDRNTVGNKFRSGGNITINS